MVLGERRRGPHRLRLQLPQPPPLRRMRVRRNPDSLRLRGRDADDLAEPRVPEPREQLLAAGRAQHRRRGEDDDAEVLAAVDVDEDVLAGRDEHGERDLQQAVILELHDRLAGQVRGVDVDAGERLGRVGPRAGDGVDDGAALLVADEDAVLRGLVAVELDEALDGDGLERVVGDFVGWRLRGG